MDSRVYSLVLFWNCDIIEFDSGQLSWATKEVIYE